MKLHCSLPSSFYFPTHRGDFSSPSLSNSVCDHKNSLCARQYSFSDHEKTSLRGWLPPPRAHHYSPHRSFFFLRTQPYQRRSLQLIMQTPNSL
jgi:hypothetical protein